MADRSVLVRLLANISDFRSQMGVAERSVKAVGTQAETSSRQTGSALARLSQSAKENQQAWDRAGTALTAFGTLTVATLGASIKAAIDWESAWAGVTKTVNGSDQELAGIETGLRRLATTLPATHGEIAAVAEAAGQLGVQTSSIVDFTRTMIDLGETTNLSADEAATSLAQLMNVMQTAPKDVGRLGASLVALGNAGASTEADIVHMASYLTGAAKLVNASEADVLALANAMTSMGINAERGGGVMTRVLQDVYAAVQSGGPKLEAFAEVAGQTSEQFAQAFEKDPIRAIDSFIQGLNDVEASGGNVVETLDELGFKGTQDTAVLLQMKGAGDLLTDSLDLGTKAWEDNTALVEEASKRYDTTAAKIAIARNNIHDAAIEVGDVFLPIVADLSEGVADLAKGFADLPEPIQASIGVLGAVVGVGSLAGGAFLLLFPRVIETYKAFQTLRQVAPGTASALGKLGRAAQYAAGLVVLGAAVRALDESLSPTAPKISEVTRALLDMDGSVGSVNALFRDNSQNITGYSADIDTFGEAVARITHPSNTERLNDFGGALFNAVTFGGSGTGEGAASRRRALEDIQGLDESLTFLVENGNAELAAEQFGVLTEAAKANGTSVEELNELFPQYQDALKGVDNEQALAAESARLQSENAALLAQDLDTAYSSLTNYAAALGYSEEQTEKLIEDSNALGESLADFIDPLGTYQQLLQDKAQAEADAANETAENTGAATKSWEDFVDNVDVSFEEYMTSLQEQVQAQEEWQLNMLLLAGRVSSGTLAELAAMGPEGARLVADLVTRSDEELQEFDDLTARRSKEATDAWGAQLTMAQPVLAAIAAKAGQGAADAAAQKLAAGTATIAQIAAQYGVALAGGLNPILASLGKPQITNLGTHRVIVRAGHAVQEADGGVVDFYADGGVENHVAQIAPAGSWRVWAEEETGGEAYIPLHPGKRTRSVDIWREVGKRLGVEFAEFAGGGFYTPDQVPRPPSTRPFGPPLSTAGDAAMDSVYRATVDWLKENGPPGQALAWAKSQVGKPYIWGGVGPDGYDCSGFMSAIANVLLGLPPHSRRGATANFPWPGFVSGDGLFTVGSTRNALGTGIGHMAGTLMGVNVESRGGEGVVVGSRARGAHDALFATVAHLAMAKGGVLNPHVRDFGGPLLPGFTFNGTGRPEWVTPMVASGPPGGGWDGKLPPISVDARVFVGDQEITDIVRVEATAVVAEAFDYAGTAAG